MDSNQQYSQLNIETILNTYHDIFNTTNEYGKAVRSRAIIDFLLYSRAELLHNAGNQSNSFKLLVLNTFEYIMEEYKFTDVHNFCIAKYSEILNKNKIVQLPKFIPITNGQILVPRQKRSDDAFRYMLEHLGQMDEYLNNCLNNLEETYNLISSNNFDKNYLTQLNDAIRITSTIIYRNAEYYGDNFENFISTEINFDDTLNVLLRNLIKYSSTLTTIHMLLQNTDEIQLQSLKLLGVYWKLVLRQSISQNTNFEFEPHKHILMNGLLINFFKKYIIGYDDIMDTFKDYYEKYHIHIGNLYYDDYLKNIYSDYYKKYLALCAYENYLRADMFRQITDTTITRKMSELKTKYEFENKFNNTPCYYLNIYQKLSPEKLYGVNTNNQLFQICKELQEYNITQPDDYKISVQNITLYTDKMLKNIINNHNKEIAEVTTDFDTGMYGLLSNVHYYARQNKNITKTNDWSKFIKSYVEFIQDELHWYSFYIKQSAQIQQSEYMYTLNKNIQDYREFLNTTAYEHFNSTVFKSEIINKLTSDDLLLILGTIYNTFVVISENEPQNDYGYLTLFKDLSKQYLLKQLSEIANSSKNLSSDTLNIIEMSIINLVNNLNCKMSEWGDIFEKIVKKIIEYYNMIIDNFHKVYINSVIDGEKKNIGYKLFNMINNLKSISVIDSKYNEAYNEILNGIMG